MRHADRVTSGSRSSAGRSAGSPRRCCCATPAATSPSTSGRRSTLEARGAGHRVARRRPSRYFVERPGVDPDEISTSTAVHPLPRPDGSRRARREHRPTGSRSWNTIYRALLDAFAAERYLLGQELDGVRAGRRRRGAHLRATGPRDRADLLVCADGIGSHRASRLLPEVTPAYAGYVAWRGTVPEAELTRRRRTPRCTTRSPTRCCADSHILVYPIPGPDGPCSRDAG